MSPRSSGFLSTTNKDLRKGTIFLPWQSFVSHSLFLLLEMWQSFGGTWHIIPKDKWVWWWWGIWRIKTPLVFKDAFMLQYWPYKFQHADFLLCDAIKCSYFSDSVRLSGKYTWIHPDYSSCILSSRLFTLCKYLVEVKNIKFHSGFLNQNVLWWGRTQKSVLTSLPGASHRPVRRRSIIGCQKLI